MREPRSASPNSPINIDALIAPVGGNGGTGPDLRFDPTYKAIIEARREENARLPQGVWAHDVKRADWPTVERLCSDILRARSKDLQVACWLSEAVVHQTGFAGIAPGLRLLAALCRRFWPDLHPAIDDGDIGPRLAPFEWLNARFPPMLRNLPIVCSVPNPEEVFTWTDYKNAQLLEKLRQSDPKSVERSEAAGAVSLAAFTALRGRTETQFWRDINVSLTAATAALAELNATLEETCGRDAPGLGGIGEAISDILNVTSIALAERQPKPFSLLRRATVSPTPAVAEPDGTGRDAAITQWHPVARGCLCAIGGDRRFLAAVGAAQPSALPDPLCRCLGRHVFR